VITDSNCHTRKHRSNQFKTVKDSIVRILYRDVYSNVLEGAFLFIWRKKQVKEKQKVNVSAKLDKLH